MHLLIDGSQGDAHKLASESVLYDLLRRVPEAMDMTPISPPYVQHYGGGQKPEDGGLSGFVLIAESHLSFHTFPARGLVWADLFSCKTFEVGPLVDMVSEAFGLGTVNFMRVERGLEEPRDCHRWVERDKQ
jgi:S-adenosylmethionine decarboxylase